MFNCRFPRAEDRLTALNAHVLTSEQNLLAAQLSSITDKLQQLKAAVTLYTSLGEDENNIPFTTKSQLPPS